MKTNIYNVVILDKSGSMQSIKQEAINGYNETLQTIKVAQQKYAETQNHFVSLVIFDSESTDTLYDRVACIEASELTEETYQPGSLTPLYDAMGTTLSKFRHTLDATADHKVLVTIITDGQENASKEYSGKQIHQIVNELKVLGWVFTYIGANQNLEEVAKTIAVTNVLNFKSTSVGTQAMFAKERKSRMRFFDRVAEKLEDTILQSGFFEDDDDIKNKV